MSVILVPFDASQHAYKALHIALDLSEKYKTNLVLIHVAGATRTEENAARAAAIVSAAKKKLNHRSADAAEIEVVYGVPAECILLAAKRFSASTIVMGCRGASASEESMFGSVSQEIFRRADCTCISVK
ncbi:MAG: hypothetical protein DHS20C08_03950 [Rhodomicrobium sp.]|nr:MAG: hypothetical protein DHS20C08_03950 [Rhodomicrobium sp.]